MDEALAVFGAFTAIGVVLGLICLAGMRAVRKISETKTDE